MSSWIYRADAELPAFAVAWYDGTGALIDFSSGYTFELKLVAKSDGTVALTKTTGIVGAATSPNVNVPWAAGDLNVAPGLYTAHLKATNGSGDRFFAPGSEPSIKILPAI